MVNWDEHNAGHIERHGITTGEVEEALGNVRQTPAAARRGFGEHRYAAIALTAAGRLLYVVFVRRGDEIRPITARDATPAERRRYRRNR